MRLAAAVVALSLGWGGGAAAQEPEDQGDLINYAYASVFGSGLYAVAGRSVQVYRLPFSYRLRSAEESGWGVKLKLPVTFGFYDFEASSIGESGLPDDVDAASFVPEVQFEVPLGRRWTLKPLVSLGLAKDLEGGNFNYIYSAGLKSYYRFPWKNARMTLVNSLLWVGHTVEGTRQDAMGRFQTGIDARLPLVFEMLGEQADLSLFAIGYLYLDNVEFLRPGDEPVSIDDEYEIGVSFGTTKRIKLWKFKLPRIGLSYRLTDDLAALRLILGHPM